MVGKVISTSIILMIPWLALTLSLDPQELLLGGVLSIMIAWATGGVFTGNLIPLLVPKRFFALVDYGAYFLLQMIRANLDVARRVLCWKTCVSPGIVEAEIRLESNRAKTILANSITLTPGTLSVDIHGSRLYIHWIALPPGDVSLETQKMVDGFADRLEKIFE